MARLTPRRRCYVRHALAGGLCAVVAHTAPIGERVVLGPHDHVPVARRVTVVARSGHRNVIHGLSLRRTAVMTRVAGTHHFGMIETQHRRPTIGCVALSAPHARSHMVRRHRRRARPADTGVTKLAICRCAAKNATRMTALTIE